MYNFHFVGREKLFQLGLDGNLVEVFPEPHQRRVFRPDPWQEGWLREYMLTCIASEDIVSRTDWDKLKQLARKSPNLLSASASAVERNREKAAIGLYKAKHDEEGSFGGRNGRQALYRMATIGYVNGHKSCCRFFEVAGAKVRNAATAYRSAPASKEDVLMLWDLYTGERGIQVSNLDRQARAARQIIEDSLIWPKKDI